MYSSAGSRASRACAAVRDARSASPVLPAGDDPTAYPDRPAPALANSRASSSASVMSSDNGQFSAARLEPAVRQPHRRRGCPQPPRNLAGRHPGRLNLITSRTWRIASLSVGTRSLRKAERRDRIGARRGFVASSDIIPVRWARSSRSGGRDQIGTVGRDDSAIVGDLERNQQPRTIVARLPEPGQVHARPCDAARPLSRDFR